MSTLKFVSMVDSSVDVSFTDGWLEMCGMGVDETARDVDVICALSVSGNVAASHSDIVEGMDV